MMKYLAYDSNNRILKYGDRVKLTNPIDDGSGIGWTKSGTIGTITWIGPDEQINVSVGNPYKLRKPLIGIGQDVELISLAKSYLRRKRR